LKPCILALQFRTGNAMPALYNESVQPSTLLLVALCYGIRDRPVMSVSVS